MGIIMNKFKLGLLTYDSNHCDILDFYSDKLDTIYFNSDGNNLCSDDEINKTEKEPHKQNKSAACQAQFHIHFSEMKVAYWKADPGLRNEPVPPCIMLNQTSDPCPGLASRFPGPHTFPAGRAVLPWRYLRSAPGLLARSGSKFSIQFSLPRPRSRSARTL